MAQVSGRPNRLVLRWAALIALSAVALLGAVACRPPADEVAPPSPLPPSATPDYPSGEASCTPTAPNGQSPPGEPYSPQYLGNGEIFTALWIDGVVVFERGGAGEIRDDGSLAMKWPFWRGEGIEGDFTVGGRSLHRPGLTVSAEIPDGYGTTGVQPTTLVFPEAGCWEVTASVGDASLTFVTKVDLQE